MVCEAAGAECLAAGGVGLATLVVSRLKRQREARLLEADADPSARDMLEQSQTMSQTHADLPSVQ